VDGFPSITALSFKGDLTLAVGTFTGQVMLYDIRAKKPFIVKNHVVGLPIKNIEFIESEGLVASLDPTAVKFWKQNTAEMYTSVTAPVHLNDLCIVPNSGLFFLANEDEKILSYFIPSIGPAPKWCCFLDNITEELEESKQDAAVYDDYKFVTQSELEQLHLDHLIGTNLLRAYMHGYFMDMRLYNKAKSIVQPEAYSDLKKKMIQNKIEEERNTKQIHVKHLPTINRDYAQKLLEKKNNKLVKTPFEDDRFKDLFENPDFVIKETDDDYARIKGTVQKSNKKQVTFVQESEPLDLYEDDDEMKVSSNSESEFDEESELSEEEIPVEKKRRGRLQPVDSDRFNLLKKEDENEDLTVPIEERLKKTQAFIKERDSAIGNKNVSWTTTKTITEKQKKRAEERKAHMKEREKYRRPAKYLKKSATVHFCRIIAKLQDVKFQELNLIHSQMHIRSTCIVIYKCYVMEEQNAVLKYFERSFCRSSFSIPGVEYKHHSIEEL
ncbi:nucleolar protein 10, partial [Trichonephila clavata]